MNDITGALPAQLAIHLKVWFERPKVLIQGRRGSGMVATDRSVHLFQESRDANGLPALHHNSIAYSNLGAIDYLPAHGWFSRPRVRAGHLLLELDKQADGVAPPEVDELQVLLGMRDYDLRREYQSGADPDFSFPCPGCGQKASAQRAAETKLRLAAEHLEWDAQTWDHTQVSEEPLTIETVELLLRVPYRWAAHLLDEAVRVGLLARQRKSFFRAVSLCDTCYEARIHPPEPPSAPEPKPRRRDPIPPRLRFTVMQRDGFRCRYCGKSAGDGVVLHVDHVEPVAAGGETTEDNLITACDECNLGKSDRDLFA